MNHRTTAGFWKCFEQLPEAERERARRNYRTLEADPRHPSLHFKKLGGKSPPVWSVRVGRGYRALGLEKGDVIFWFWIGTHADYDASIA